MVTKLVVKTEFEMETKQRTYSFAKVIVDTILQNLKSKRQHIHVFAIEVLDEEEIYDVTLHRENFLETLIDLLPIYEQEEDYLGCIEIQNAIKQIQHP